MDRRRFGGWSAYQDALVDVQLADRIVTLGPEGLVDGGPWSPRGPVYVITAHNPGRLVGAGENEAAQDALVQFLLDERIPWIPAVGRSRDRSWVEPSVVVEIAEAEALRIGAVFEQDAIFRWDGSSLTVISCKDK